MTSRLTRSESEQTCQVSSSFLDRYCPVDEVVQLVIDSFESIVKSVRQCGRRFVESGQCGSEDAGLESGEESGYLPTIRRKEVPGGSRRSRNEPLEPQPLKVVGHPCRSVGV